MIKSKFFLCISDSCDHKIGYVYYIESVANSKWETLFEARQCDSLENYLNGSCSCGFNRQAMGFHANLKYVTINYLVILYQLHILFHMFEV